VKKKLHSTSFLNLCVATFMNSTTQTQEEQAKEWFEDDDRKIGGSSNQDCGENVPGREGEVACQNKTRRVK